MLISVLVPASERLLIENSPLVPAVIILRGEIKVIRVEFIESADIQRGLVGIMPASDEKGQLVVSPVLGAADNRVDMETHRCGLVLGILQFGTVPTKPFTPDHPAIRNMRHSAIRRVRPPLHGAFRLPRMTATVHIDDLDRLRRIRTTAVMARDKNGISIFS